MYLVLGVGNDLLGDDGVGPYVAEALHNSEWEVLNAGIVPENFIRPIRTRKPDIIVIVDAVDMGSAPGTIRIIPSEYIRDAGIGTHQMSLAYLIDQVSPWSKIYFIGIQPSCLDPDTPLTVPVRSAADSLITIIRSHDFDKVLVLGKEDAKEQD